MDESEAKEMAEMKFESSPKPPVMIVRVTDSGSETFHIPTKEVNGYINNSCLYVHHKERERE
jgi:hypothetical protein